MAAFGGSAMSALNDISSNNSVLQGFLEWVGVWLSVAGLWRLYFGRNNPM